MATILAVSKYLLPVLLAIVMVVLAEDALQQMPEDTASISLSDSSSDGDSMMTAEKRVPLPSGWRRQPGRVRSYHAMEMPDFSSRSRGFNRFFGEYAQRPMFVRYMRSFAAPGK